MSGELHTDPQYPQPGRTFLRKERLPVLLGIATNAAVTWCATQTPWGESIHRIVVSDFIPLGAIVCGALGASGLTLGLQFLQQRITRSLTVSVVVLALVSCLAIHYIRCVQSTTGNAPNTPTMGFWQHFRKEFDPMPPETLAQYFRASQMISPGPPAIFAAPLDIIGFIIGGFLSFGYLYGRPYCDRCGRYWRRYNFIKQYRNADAARPDFTEIKSLLRGRRWQEAVDLLMLRAEPRPLFTQGLIEMTLWRCPQCSVCKVTFELKSGTQTDSDRVDEIEVEPETHVSIPEDPRGRESARPHWRF